MDDSLGLIEQRVVMDFRDHGGGAMGEARRRRLADLKMVEIGARIVSSPDSSSVAITHRERITIEELEARARAFLAPDPEPFTPAAAFIYETRWQVMKDGSRQPRRVKVHPDRRVQEFLETIREAEVMKALDKVREEHGIGEIIGVRDAPPDLADDEIKALTMRRP